MLPSLVDRFRPSPSRALALLVVCTSALLAACSSLEFSSTGPGEDRGTLTMFVEIPEEQVRQAQIAGGSSPSFSVRIEEEADTLNLVVIRLAVDQVEFGRTSGECTDSSTTDDGDACREAVVDPTAMELPVDAQRAQLTNALVSRTGTYDRLEMDFHLVEMTDNALLFQEQFQVGTSVLMRGTFNGTGVEAFFSPEGSVEIPLNPPISLQEGQAASITLVVDVSGWFRDQNGDLINPNEAANDPTIADMVEQNIAESFSARTDVGGS